MVDNPKNEVTLLSQILKVGEKKVTRYGLNLAITQSFDNKPIFGALLRIQSILWNCFYSVPIFQSIGRESKI